MDVSKDSTHTLLCTLGFHKKKFLPLVSILECHPDALVLVSGSQQTIKLAFTPLIGGLALA